MSLVNEGANMVLFQAYGEVSDNGAGTTYAEGVYGLRVCLYSGMVQIQASLNCIDYAVAPSPAAQVVNHAWFELSSNSF